MITESCSVVHDCHATIRVSFPASRANVDFGQGGSTLAAGVLMVNTIKYGSTRERR
jgi:hypothetical protein